MLRYGAFRQFNVPEPGLNIENPRMWIGALRQVLPDSADTLSLFDQLSDLGALVNGVCRGRYVPYAEEEEKEEYEEEEEDEDEDEEEEEEEEVAALVAGETVEVVEGGAMGGDDPDDKGDDGEDSSEDSDNSCKGLGKDVGDDLEVNVPSVSFCLYVIGFSLNDFCSVNCVQRGRS